MTWTIFLFLWLISGISSPSMYTSDVDFRSAAKSSQPPIIEVPIIPIVDREQRPLNLSRTSILRTNEPPTKSVDDDDSNRLFIVPQPNVRVQKVTKGRARRTLTDDGSTDVVHHISIVSPPPSYTAVKRITTPIPTTVRTSRTDEFEVPCAELIPPPDFIDRTHIRVPKGRARVHTVQPLSNVLTDRVLSTTQPTITKDDDYGRSPSKPAKVKHLYQF